MAAAPWTPPANPHYIGGATTIGCNENITLTADAVLNDKILLRSMPETDTIVIGSLRTVTLPSATAFAQQMGGVAVIPDELTVRTTIMNITTGNSTAVRITGGAGGTALDSSASWRRTLLPGQRGTLDIRFRNIAGTLTYTWFLETAFSNQTRLILGPGTSAQPAIQGATFTDSGFTMYSDYVSSEGEPAMISDGHIGVSASPTYARIGKPIWRLGDYADAQDSVLADLTWHGVTKQVWTDSAAAVTADELLGGRAVITPTAHRTKALPLGTAIETALQAIIGNFNATWTLEISNLATAYYLLLQGDTGTALTPSSLFLLPGATASILLRRVSANTYTAKVTSLAGGSITYSDIAVNGLDTVTTDVTLTVEANGARGRAHVAGFTGTSTSTDMSITTGLDATITTPARDADLATCVVQDNTTTTTMGTANVTAGAITFALGVDGEGFTAANTKGLIGGAEPTWPIV